MYFILMHNLDVFPESSVVFKYDLKFSEFNRKHCPKSDALRIKQILLQQELKYKDLFHELTYCDEIDQIPCTAVIEELSARLEEDVRDSINRSVIEGKTKEVNTLKKFNTTESQDKLLE